MAVEINVYPNTIASKDGKKILPNNNALYGPYNSLQEAWDAVYGELGSNIPVGLPVGVMNPTTLEIKEYWFSGGNSYADLVPKTTADTHMNTEEEGWFVVDKNNNVGMRYTPSEGLDAAKVSEHFANLIAQKQGAVTSESITEIKKLSQSEYDALASKSDNVLYIIV